MVPSSTRNCSAGTPSRFEPFSNNKRRASAAALRSSRPPFDTPVLPEAPPWLHEVPVSPISTSTLSQATSSSSATICAITTSRPCPMSILPKKACTRPSGSTAIQESSSVGTSAGLPPATCASAPVSGGAANETTSAPEVFRNSRRVRVVMVFSSRQASLRALDGAQDGHVRSAAALEPGEGVAQLRVARLRVLLEVSRGGHHPAVDAVAALRHLLLDIRRLPRVRLVRRAEALEGGDRPAARGGHRQHARAHRLAVQVHRASAALRAAAAEVGIIETEIVAQGIQQGHLGLGVHSNALAVNGELEAGHASSLLMAARRQPGGERRKSNDQPDQQENASDERHAGEVDVFHRRARRC